MGNRGGWGREGTILVSIVTTVAATRLLHSDRQRRHGRMSLVRTKPKKNRRSYGYDSECITFCVRNEVLIAPVSSVVQNSSSTSQTVKDCDTADKARNSNKLIVIWWELLRSLPLPPPLPPHRVIVTTSLSILVCGQSQVCDVSQSAHEQT